MLRSRQDFEALQEGGRARSHPLLVVRFRANDVGQDRFGIATGRRLGSAVVRNRVRRRIREILRSRPAGPGPSRDILVVARPASVTATYEQLRMALEKVLPGGPSREGTTTQ
jgi:ribonuclease P protein component